MEDGRPRDEIGRGQTRDPARRSPRSRRRHAHARQRRHHRLERRLGHAPASRFAGDRRSAARRDCAPHRRPARSCAARARASARRSRVSASALAAPALITAGMSIRSSRVPAPGRRALLHPGLVVARADRNRRRSAPCGDALDRGDRAPRRGVRAGCGEAVVRHRRRPASAASVIASAPPAGTNHAPLAVASMPSDRARRSAIGGETVEPSPLTPASTIAPPATSATIAPAPTGAASAITSKVKRRDAVAEIAELQILEHRIGAAAMRRGHARALDRGDQRIGRLVLAARDAAGTRSPS